MNVYITYAFIFTSFVKLVCEGAEERVVGLHVVGMGADEMLQGFGKATQATLYCCSASPLTPNPNVVCDVYINIMTG